MYHSHFKGTHYEAGFRWGSLLLKNQNSILKNLPFKITQERTNFAESCLTSYREFYPEILEEIRGIADGQQCDVNILQTVLFGMYALPPTCNCSCFAMNSGNEILLGRNSDFRTELEKLNMNVIYRLKGAYSFTGNTTAFSEIEDGVNEHGLAVGLTSVYPQKIKSGFNAGMILRYLLEKCKNVQEAVLCLQSLPIASAQTIILADAAGKIALVECDSDGIEVAPSMIDDGKFVCAVNRFNLERMAEHNCVGIDDWHSEARFKTMFSALRSSFVNDLPTSIKLLSGDYGFICQYDRSEGKDTVWSVIYDLKWHKIYRCEGNPRRRKFKEDLRFEF